MRIFIDEMVLHGLGKDIESLHTLGEGLGQQVSDDFPELTFLPFFCTSLTTPCRF